jgi:hypothetical protein
MSLTPTHVRVTVTTMPASSTRSEVAVPESWWPRWSRDGRRLFFATLKDVQPVDVHIEPGLRLGIPRRLFERPVMSSGSATPFDVSADGERFLVVEPDKSMSPLRSMVVVLNFTPDGGSGNR